MTDYTLTTNHIRWMADILSRDFLSNAKRNLISGSLGLPLHEIEEYNLRVRSNNWKMFDFFFYSLHEYKSRAGSNATLQSVILRLKHLNLNNIVDQINANSANILLSSCNLGSTMQMDLISNAELQSAVTSGTRPSFHEVDLTNCATANSGRWNQWITVRDPVKPRALYLNHKDRHLDNIVVGQSRHDTFERSGSHEVEGTYNPRFDHNIDLISEPADIYRKIGERKIGCNDNFIIGRGRFSHVCLGYFEEPDHPAAIKVMDNSSKEAYAAWKKEVKILRKMKHTNIVAYLCSEELGNQLFIAMELADTTLECLITQRFPFPPGSGSGIEFPPLCEEDIRKFLYQACRGLKALHEKNIVHRDIKPSNILIVLKEYDASRTAQRIAKISDLGLSKELDSSAINSASSVKGTMSYMSPECIRACFKETKFVSTKESDIFSLGLTFFFALTQGKHPCGVPIFQNQRLLEGKLNLDLISKPKNLLDFYHLISAMLSVENPKERPTIEAIYNHPYFWDSNKRLRFICNAVEFMNSKPPKATKFKTFDQKGKLLIRKGWREIIPEVFNVLPKSLIHHKDPDRYNTNSLVDLIRFIRNYHAHFSEQPKKFQILFSNDRQHIYMSYFSNCFPFLIPFLYVVLQNHRTEPNCQEFFFEFGNDGYSFPSLPGSHASYAS